MSEYFVFDPGEVNYLFPADFEVGTEVPSSFKGIVVDMSVCPQNEKIKNLERLKEYQVITELSFLNGEEVMKACPWVKGSISLLFHGKGNSLECTAGAEELVRALGKEPLVADSPGCGFTFPRVLAQIINEGYFALEEKMACEEDMDRAMRFGVNYPEGPFTWGNRVGKRPITLLLEALFKTTGDKRYQVAPLLQD